MNLLRAGLVALGVMLSSVVAHAQQNNMYWLNYGGPGPIPPSAWTPVTAANPLPVTGSFSATTTGFPGSTQTTGTPISVTSSGVTGSLPAGAVVVANNVGATNTAYCKLGASATTSDQAIPPNSWFAFTVGSNTQLTCITSASTTTINMVGGSGLPTGAGGGGGGGSASNTTASGSITSTQSVTVSPGPGQSSVGIQVTGTWTGTLFVEASVDGTNFVQTTTVPVTSGSVQVATITANGSFQANVAGFASFRIRGNTVASGTAVVTLISTAGVSTVMADNPFPVTGYTGMTPLNMQGTIAIGSATSAFPLMIGGTSTGTSGGNAQVAKVDSSGNQYNVVTAASGAFSAGAGVDGWDLTQGTKADAACAGDNTSGCSVESRLQRIAQNLTALNSTAGNPLAAGSAIIGKVGIDQTTDGTTNGVRLTTQYPAGATAVQGSTTGTTGATAATLAATASVTNYVCSISIRANATAAATGNATLSDGIKTFNFTQWTAPNASGVGVIEEIFTPCYPASAVDTAWTLTSAAPGTGGVVSVAIAGYQK